MDLFLNGAARIIQDKYLQIALDYCCDGCKTGVLNHQGHICVKPGTDELLELWRGQAVKLACHLLKSGNLPKILQEMLLIQQSENYPPKKTSIFWPQIYFVFAEFS